MITELFESTEKMFAFTGKKVRDNQRQYSKRSYFGSRLLLRVKKYYYLVRWWHIGKKNLVKENLIDLKRKILRAYAFFFFFLMRCVAELRNCYTIRNLGFITYKNTNYKLKYKSLSLICKRGEDCTLCRCIKNEIQLFIRHK